MAEPPAPPSPTATLRQPGILAGILVAGLVALAAHALHQLLPSSVSAVVGEALLAIALGLLVTNLTPPPIDWSPGLRLTVKTALPIAIVLLGARMALDQIVGMGAHALILIGTLMTLALTMAHAMGRWLQIPVRIATLIAVGAAICGNTAIAAIAPVIRAKDDEMAFAIAINTLLGTIAMLSFPLVGHALGFSDAWFGTWAGVAVNDTSQVVATGFAYSPTAGEVATVVKLTRNGCMAFVIVGLGLAYSRFDPERTDGAPVSLRQRIAKSFPNFLIGFLLLATANSLGWIDAASAAIDFDLAGAAKKLFKGMVLLALAAVGLSTNFRQLARTGLAPVWVGVLTMLSTTIGSLVLLSLMGPVSL